jgi:hypothetical protein
MGRLAMALGLLAVAACNPSGSSERKPTGTPGDPVDVCERLADVCRLDSSRLGVCIAPPPGNPPASCEGRDPCFICAPQH